MDAVVVFSPAKVNLMLAVTGRREDGFHELVSVVAPVTFGDTIRLRRTATPGEIVLTTDLPTLPTGPGNLAVRAVEAFRQATGECEGVAIELTKRIPLGAGLGGGSSNAVAVLRGLNTLHGAPVGDEQLGRLAAGLGSDCPLFLAGGVCLMRGRGERISHLTPAQRSRFASARLLLFKPDFGIATPWAYAQLAAAHARSVAAYLEPAKAEAQVTNWLTGTAPARSLLYNSFEPVVFQKYRALPSLVAWLCTAPGVDGVLLSGSGSACFALLAPDANSVNLAGKIRECLGAGAFVHEASIA